jgi:tetratricopeptide (TPR) repeat protein
LLACATSLAAPPPLAGRAYELADQAYKAVAANELERAMSLTSEALRAAPGHPSLLRLQADILTRQGKTAEAVERLRGVPAADLGGEGLAQRGYLHLKAEDRAAAEADFRAAMQSGELSAEQRGNLTTELGYLAMRAGRNAEAVELLSKSVESWHAAPPDKKPFDATALHGMRRTIDTLSRRWGATFSLGSGTQATAASGLGAAAGDARVVQAGAEVFYMPEGFGYRSGRVFQVYANAFQSVWSNDDAVITGREARVAGVGARYKPFETVNLIFAVERRFAVGDLAGDDDWLLRAGWSTGANTDWDPVRSRWPTWQVYTESAYFTKARRLIQPFDARAGYSFKLPQWYGTVVTPFLGLAGEYDEAQQEKTAAGIGPGIVVRHWFRESRERAFGSYVDFSLQYRKRLTDARRGEGLFGFVTVSF